jgi:phage uncharacterized protein (putative large terminase), C-terminal domain
MPVAIPECVEPQPGPQEDFLQCSARIVFYGGAAGGGKSYAALLEPLFDIGNPKFEAVLFRRIYKQLAAPGGLIPRSFEIYPQLGAHYHKNDMTWTFPSGAKVRFAHIQYEQDVLDWKGSEIALIEVDETTETSEYQFFYLFSRNRSVSGVTPRMRGFTNPDPDSWVKVLLAPWVDDTWPEDDRAESGEVRWFVRKDDVIQWVDKDTPHAISITFFFANLYDNKILMQVNPEYEAGLQALPEHEKRRLLFGDWNARPSGKKFKREWFASYFDKSPLDIEKLLRFWDKAATAKKKKRSRRNGPDYTASVLIGRRKEGAYPRYVVLDATWDQLDPGGVEALIKAIAEQDGREVHVRIEQEGGSSGKQDIFNFVTKVLVGYDVEGIPSTGSKELRADTFAAQCKVGNVGMLRAWWNNGYLNFLCAFPDEDVHDDPVDASSGAFNCLYIEPPKRRGGMVVHKPTKEEQHHEEDELAWH